MNKELIAKQKKFLGLFFGSWALILLNWLIMHLCLNPLMISLLDRRFVPSGGWSYVLMSAFALSIFQMWAIYKYILKK
ncbi:MAG: hypothetical protein HOK52_03830 [Candidatus Marinimicrobia bacterium]|jgi:hypothetical protein|nr:hypothetical protein [Candidatus Scalindua sp.]MBT6470370.1 hypothetical protein [Candidatus Neomarinimicrobiota bacterium]